MAGVAQPKVFRFRAEARTHRGMVRARNEDALLIRSDEGMWAVADGMGGHDRGDEASLALTEALGAMALGRGLAPSAHVRAIEETVARVHARLKAEATRARVEVIGTTLAAVHVIGDLATCLWIGDSRVYHWSDGRLTLATRDHATGGGLTRAVGAGSACWLDTAVVRLRARDRLLLCSDGLNREVSDREIGEHLDSGINTLTGCADRLLDTALGRGARDNVSLIVVEAMP